jgi:hypothetical protein
MLDVLEQRRLSGPSVVKRFSGGSSVSTKDSLACSRYERLGLFLQRLDGEARNLLFLQWNTRFR